MATQTEALQASDVVSTLEKDIHDFFRLGNHFLLSDNVLKLRAVLKKHFSDVYRTPEAIEHALNERVEDIREKLILAEMSDAKNLAEAGKDNFQDHAIKAFELVGMPIDDYKPARNYNWVNRTVDSLDKTYRSKQGITEQKPKPTPFTGTTIEALDRHMKQSAFCRAINAEHNFMETILFKAFIDKDPVSIKANASLLYSFLKQSYKGGAALENAVENDIEGIRELAILDILGGAKLLAKDGKKTYLANIERAVSVLMADVGIDWNQPEGYQSRFKKKYAWFENACMNIKDIYSKKSLSA